MPPIVASPVFVIVLADIVELANGVLPVTSYKSKSDWVRPFNSLAGTNVNATLAFSDVPELVMVNVRFTLLFTQPIALLVPVLRNTVVAPGAVPAVMLRPMPPNASANVLSVRVVCTLPNMYEVGDSTTKAVAFNNTLLLPVVRTPDVQARLPDAPIFMSPLVIVNPAALANSTL